MPDKEHENPFVEVHRRAQAFKDRLSAANKNDAEARKIKAIQEANNVFNADPL
jgi:hypothetical protein